MATALPFARQGWSHCRALVAKCRFICCPPSPESPAIRKPTVSLRHSCRRRGFYKTVPTPTRAGMPPRQAGYDRPRAQARAVGGPHLHNVITPAAPADRLLLDSSSTRRPRPVDVSGIHILCKASSVLKEAYGTLGLQSKRHENELFPDRNLGPALQSLVGYLDLTGLSSNL
ncbi:hypothetical protein HPB50_015356 [Hyalomma asiaticum]|uniref:Uncharacterized protein n=1 Tax=Hyalomma asiaticum TaxID=266040 RepID=A0ACB7TDZ4_HYAAI|nr:hypothetical protein HPB50_015356 [Hyalomma asiaticum]